MKSTAESSSQRNFRPTVPAGTPRLVGVIADCAALEKATRLRVLPDFFELRLDALIGHLEKTEQALPRLRAPLVFTARHPAEGGAHALSLTKRADLLRRFLGHAAFLDIELRSAPQMEPLLAEARRRKVAVLVSVHHLRETPSRETLRAQLDAALAYRPASFKIVTRTDTAAELDRLLSFFRENFKRLPLAAMGIGKLGSVSRGQLLRLGSVLNYAAVGAANAPGQPTLRKLRCTRNAYIK